MTNASMPERSVLTAREIRPSQVIALVVGAAFTLVGILGFAVTGTADFASADTDEALLGFELNPLHNVVHLIIGGAGLLLWRTVPQARLYGWLLFAGYGATFIYGLFVVNSTSDANFLSINAADNGLHLAAALIGLACALMPNEQAPGRRLS